MEKKKRAKYGPIGLRLHALIDWLLVLAGLTGPFVLDIIVAALSQRVPEENRTLRKVDAIIHPVFPHFKR